MIGPSQLRRLERASRIARGKRPENCVTALNRRIDKLFEDLPKTIRGATVFWLHPTKGYRFRAVR